MSCSISGYCISNTNTLFDDNYFSAGTYNGNIYYTGQNNSYTIYYSSGNSEWCLSLSLGGPCLLFGPSPSSSICPDFYDEYISVGICPTTTSTSTINCGTFDFDALLDCDVIPTPTPTPTLTITPTASAPLPPDPCSGVSVSAILSAHTSMTSTPTSTPTPTPTSVVYNCELSGNVTFNVIDVNIKCPISKEFKDCTSGSRFYTNDILYNPSGGPILVGMVFEGIVDGENRCISYVGINHDNSPINSIDLFSGPWGIFPDGCFTCYNQPTPTPTPTKTLSPTPTPTNTTINIPCSNCDPLYSWSAYSGSSCYRIETSGATEPNPLETWSASPAQNQFYTRYGTIFYNKPYPLNGSGSSFTLIKTESVWGNSGQTINNGPMNRCSIWTTVRPSDWQPQNIWIGFSRCFVVTGETRTYYFGVAADNNFRAVLDNNTILNTIGGPFDGNSRSFNYWHVYPVDLSPGRHILELYGLNNAQVAGFGCTIYDATFDQLTGATSVSQLKNYEILTSSGQTIFQVIQSPLSASTYLSSGYTCPSGYNFAGVGDACDECIKFIYCDNQPLTPTPTSTPTSTPTMTPTSSQT